MHEPKWKKQEVFPVIARLILSEWRKQPECFISHSALTDALLQDPEAVRLVDQFGSTQRRKLTSNMIAWFSQQITIGRSVWAPFFERRRERNRWAYRPITAELPLGGDPDLEAVEGEPRLVAHLRRERDTKLAKHKKELVLKATGKLACEVCNFDFARQYAEVGDGFCEVHHTQPLGDVLGSQVVKPADLAVLCANCHRMIHRTRPIESVQTFKARLRQPSNKSVQPTRAAEPIGQREPARRGPPG